MIDLKGNETGDDMLFQIFESVTDTFLKMQVRAAGPPQAAAQPDSLWTGTISITGGFNGAVSLTCSQEFARRAAQTLCGEGFAQNELFAQDVLAEWTNIVAGNIKGLLSETRGTACAMSTPSISEGTIIHPNATLLTQLWATCGRETLRLSIVEANGSRKPCHT